MVHECNNGVLAYARFFTLTESDKTCAEIPKSNCRKAFILLVNPGNSMTREVSARTPGAVAAADFLDCCREFRGLRVPIPTVAAQDFLCYGCEFPGHGFVRLWMGSYFT